MATNQEKITRGMIYAFGRIIIFVVAVLIIALGFFTAMNSMNVNVIIRDAFALREEYVLQRQNILEGELDNLFVQEFIDSDPMLNTIKYRDYDIDSYYQRADVDTAVVWPWMDTVTVHATENVLDIQGTPVSSEDGVPVSSVSNSSVQAAGEDMPPEWQSAEYDVVLVKDADTSSWKVQEMIMKKEIKPVINQPSQPASPSASQTPKSGASGQ